MDGGFYTAKYMYDCCFMIGTGRSPSRSHCVKVDLHCVLWFDKDWLWEICEACGIRVRADGVANKHCVLLIVKRLL